MTEALAGSTLSLAFVMALVRPLSCFRALGFRPRDALDIRLERCFFCDLLGALAAAVTRDAVLLVIAHSSCRRTIAAVGRPWRSTSLQLSSLCRAAFSTSASKVQASTLDDEPIDIFITHDKILPLPARVQSRWNLRGQSCWGLPIAGHVTSSRIRPMGRFCRQTHASGADLPRLGGKWQIGTNQRAELKC
jgi:hypothetical protein